MNNNIETLPVPVSKEESGVILIKGSRVPIDTVVYAFNQGASPEDIVMSYPTLALNDVYAVITYYLYNREDINKYLGMRELESKKIRKENEKRFNPEGIRTRLLSRQPKG